MEVVFLRVSASYEAMPTFVLLFGRRTTRFHVSHLGMQREEVEKGNVWNSLHLRATMSNAGGPQWVLLGIVRYTHWVQGWQQKQSWIFLYSHRPQKEKQRRSI